MAQNVDKPFVVGFYSTVAQADEAVRRLLAAGFQKNELAVICPEPLRKSFASDIPRAERPGSHAAEAIVEGGAVGAALGGLALVATAIATGGVGLLPAIPVLIGGGAFAGSFSGLIAADGYGKGIGQNYEEAIRQGKIVVGVELAGTEDNPRLAQAERILVETGGMSPTPARV